VISLKRISLTDILVNKLPRNSTQKNLKKAWAVSRSFVILFQSVIVSEQEQEILATWQKSSWAQKLANKEKRRSLTDFDRFKVMIAKKQKAKIVAEKLAA
jgi:large subunit ribosomal protein L14e